MEITDKMKKDFSMKVCMNCDKLYTCDNNWENDGEYVFEECVKKYYG